MANRFLIVCGGSGVGLLGQRHILGIDGEIHIDVQKEQSEERVIRDPHNLSLNVRIDQGEEMAATSVLLSEMRGWIPRYPKNSPEANHLRLLCDETLASKQLSEGLGQMPALGGGAIRIPTVNMALDNAIRQMTHVWTGGLGSGDSIQVWIVSSTCGGTGAGIQRYVAERIVESLRSVRGVRIDLRFIRVGGVTYQVFGAERINLNTFFSVAADLAFREILSKKPEYISQRVGVTCTYFYVEVPAIGGGAASKAPRAELVEMACKAIMDEEVQKRLQSIQNNADSIAVVRVGYWKKDFDDRVRIAGALKDLNEKLQELLRPKPDWVGKENSQPQFQITFDDLTRKNLGAEALALRMAAGWSFIKFDERDLALPMSELVNRWKRSLKTCLEKEIESIERNLRVLPVGGGPAEELKIGTYHSQYDPNWFESVRRAQQVSAWADHRKKELKPLLHNQAAELSNISNSRANAQEKATKMASELETFTTNLAEYLEWDAWSQKENNWLASEFQPVDQLQKQLQELQKEFPVAEEVPVTAIELDDTILGEWGKLWLWLLMKAQQSNDKYLLLKRILQGATKLTRLGLTSLLDLKDGETIDHIHRALQQPGKIVVQGKEHEAQWWQGRTPTPDVGGGGMLDMYRILPFLTQEARGELGESDPNNQVKYTYAGVGMLGLTILAFDAATLAAPNNPATTARYLLTPFANYVSEKLAGEQYLELVQASVVGEPLYRPVLEMLFKPSEVSQLAKYFPLHGKSTLKPGKAEARRARLFNELIESMRHAAESKKAEEFEKSAQLICAYLDSETGLRVQEHKILLEGREEMAKRIDRIEVVVNDQHYVAYVAFAQRPQWQLGLPERVPLVFPFIESLQMDYLNRIPAMLAQADVDGPFALVVVPDLSPDINLAIPRSQMIMDFETIIEVVSDPNPLEHLERLVVKRVDLRLISPYQSRGPISRPELYFGRKGKIETVLNHLGKASHFLVGKRRAGKTSTLFVIGNRLLLAGTQGIQIMFASLESVDNYDRLRKYLEENTDLKIPRGPIDGSLVQSLRKHSQSHRVHVVLAWDESDRLLDYDAQQGWPLFRSLRAEALAPHASFSILAAGFTSLFRYLHDGSSPLFNFGPEVLLRQLDWTGARDLIMQPMQSLGISIEENAVRKIYDLSSGDPSLVQLLCDSAVQTISQNPKEQRFVSDEIIEQASSDDTFIQEYLEVTYAFLPIIHRLVILGALRLGTSVFEESALVSQVKSIHPQIRIADIQDAIALLTIYLFDRQRKQLRWAMQTFPSTIRRHRDLDLELQNLLEALDAQ